MDDKGLIRVCDHDYLHESTHYKCKRSHTSSVYEYIKLDIYRCRKCLDKREIQTVAHERFDDPPVWWENAKGR